MEALIYLVLSFRRRPEPS